MKLFLKLLMGLKLSVASENTNTQNVLIDDANFENTFIFNEYDLYHHWNVNEHQDFHEYINQNWESILVENLNDYKEAKTVLAKTDQKLISFDNFSLTIEFNNKPDQNYLKQPLQKSFDVYFYNYDNIHQVLDEVENNFVLTEVVNSLKDTHLYDYLEDNFKDYFDELCQKYIVLNDEAEFFDYVTIKSVLKDKIVFEFLNSSQFELKIITN